MTVFTNVTVKNDDWYNINTLSGAAVGTALILQNISTGTVILKEQTAKPTDDNGPLLFSAEYGDLSKATVDGGSLAMWAKCVSPSGTAIIAVYN